MGVLNVTPDSFSDGGQFLDRDRAVEHGLRMAAEGAAIIDVGAESTRPGAQGVPGDEQVRRAVPVIKALAGQVKVPLSIDTHDPDVARAALDAGPASSTTSRPWRTSGWRPWPQIAQCPWS